MQEKFNPATAGSRMITRVPVVKTGETIQDLERILLKDVRAFDSIDYVYVVDKYNVLLGVMSIREVLHSAKNARVDEVMKKELITTHPHVHQEKVVYIALKHNIKAIPVVDKNGILLGVVPYDEILHIFNEEIHEDLFKFGGIYHKVGKDLMCNKYSALSMIKRRLPWLIIGVLGGAVTASIVTGYENVISNLLALAAFAPVLAYLSDAVGTQSETIAVRSIALDAKIPLKGYLLREFKVAVAIGAICGLLMTGVTYLGWGDRLLAAIVGTSILLSILAAVLISTLLPFLFKKLNLDPAVSSGPFATMISDAATMVVYFNVASLMTAHLS